MDATGERRGNGIRELCVLFALVLVVSFLFAFTFVQRSKNNHRVDVLENQNTFNILSPARNWYHDGPWNDYFGVIWDPVSIESPDIASRAKYTSYPPGGLVPLHLLALISGREPDRLMVLQLNMALHGILALLLAGAAYIMARRAGFGPELAAGWGLIAAFLELFLPGSYFLHHLGYWADQCVLPVFALFVFLELVRENAGKTTQRWLGAIMALTAMYGCATDYLFPFVMLGVYLKRSLAENSAPEQSIMRRLAGFAGRSVAFWSPMLIAYALFALQLHSFNAWPAIIAKFQFQAALTGDVSFLDKPLPVFFHFFRGYGPLALLLLILTPAVMISVQLWRRIHRKDANPTASRFVWAAVLYLLPCLLHFAVLSNHSRHPFHFFTAAKFTLPLAMIPFVLFPLWLLAVTGQKWDDTRRRGMGMITLGLCGLLACGYTYAVSGRTTGFYARTFIKIEERMTIACFVRENTQYEDVVFTADPELWDDRQYMYTGASRKRIYLVRNLADMAKILNPIKGDYRVNILTRTERPSERARTDVRFLDELASKATNCAKSLDALLYKIPKDAFLTFQPSQNSHNAGGNPTWKR